MIDSAFEPPCPLRRWRAVIGWTPQDFRQLLTHGGDPFAPDLWAPGPGTTVTAIRCLPAHLHLRDADDPTLVLLFELTGIEGRP
jgi:hypothetical protein